MASTSGLSAAPVGSPILPDQKLTPGEVLTTDAQVVCVAGYAKIVRDVPRSLKNQVYREYGIRSHQAGQYEIDHLISLELGGSDSIRNLWPQAYFTQPLNAHVKDRLENRLHELVCIGQISLPEAQHAIASNWTDAYRKYVGALPPEAGQAAEVAAFAPGPPVGGRVAADANGSCPPFAAVKGSKSGVYHPPGDPFYDRTRAKACFANVQDAQSAGYRAAKHGGGR